MPHRARLTVDLSAIDQNFRTIAEAAAGAEVAPVIKADAYGLGAARIAASLWKAGARTFFVARLEEGEAVRRCLGSDREARIFLLDGLIPGTEDRVRRSALIPVLADAGQVTAARAAGADLPVGLHVDTGMNRQGLSVPELAELSNSRDLQPVLLMSHLGSATRPEDPRNRLQFERFAA
ncbi:MAG: alanine racemase, partial [Phenylobacterium sp.]